MLAPAATLSDSVIWSVPYWMANTPGDLAEIPTVTPYGMWILVLTLVVGLGLKFRRRPT